MKIIRTATEEEHRRPGTAYILRTELPTMVLGNEETHGEILVQPGRTDQEQHIIHTQPQRHRMLSLSEYSLKSASSPKQHDRGTKQEPRQEKSL